MWECGELDLNLKNEKLREAEIDPQVIKVQGFSPRDAASPSEEPIAPPICRLSPTQINPTQHDQG